MTTEQRRALANTIPTTEVIRDAVTFPRDHIGEPLDIDGARFDAWLTQVRRDAAREALDGLFDTVQTESGIRLHVATRYRDTHYPEETP